MPKAYEEAGVSVEAGYEVVKRIKSHVARTNRPGVVGGIGGFGGLFDLASLGYKEPVLISGTDGVGTKLVVAKMANKHDTIGIDCVAMCVNDIAAQGAEPLFFLGTDAGQCIRCSRRYGKFCDRRNEYSLVYLQQDH